MLDITTVEQRYFELMINKTKYEIEPCKLKTLKQLMNLSSFDNEAGFDEYIKLIKKIIDKNRANQPIAMSVLEDLNMDQINSILVEYMKWMHEIKNSPNL